jgi:hypothetical protein
MAEPMAWNGRTVSRTAGSRAAWSLCETTGQGYTRAAGAGRTVPQSARGYRILARAALTSSAMSEVLGIRGGIVGGGGQESPPYVVQVLLLVHCKETM